MQELIFGLPTRMRTLKLESVLPLLEYLHGLPQAPMEDRTLSEAEDAGACDALRALPLPPDAPRLAHLVDLYAHPAHAQNRTLAVWYGIARAVARLIQDGD